MGKTRSLSAKTTSHGVRTRKTANGRLTGETSSGHDHGGCSGRPGRGGGSGRAVGPKESMLGSLTCHQLVVIRFRQAMIEQRLWEPELIDTHSASPEGTYTGA